MDEEDEGEELGAELENLSLEHGRLGDDSRSSEGDPSRFYNLQVRFQRLCEWNGI